MGNNKGRLVRYTCKTTGDIKKGIVYNKDESQSLVANGRCIVTKTDDNFNPIEVDENDENNSNRIMKKIDDLTFMGFID